MVALLPYVTAPSAPELRTIGTPSSGTLHLPIYGGLFTEEDRVISALIREVESSFVRAARAAEVISAEAEITALEAYAVIEGALAGEEPTPEALALRIRYATLIEEVGSVYVSYADLVTDATVTALLRLRCQVPTWSMEDTRGLPRVLRQAVYAIAQEETAAEHNEPTPATAEQLGKRRRATGSGAKRTGAQSGPT